MLADLPTDPSGRSPDSGPYYVVSAVVKPWVDSYLKYRQQFPLKPVTCNEHSLPNAKFEIPSLPLRTRVEAGLPVSLLSLRGKHPQSLFSLQERMSEEIRPLPKDLSPRRWAGRSGLAYARRLHYPTLPEPHLCGAAPEPSHFHRKVSLLMAHCLASTYRSRGSETRSPPGAFCHPTATQGFDCAI